VSISIRNQDREAGRMIRTRVACLAVKDAVIETSWDWSQDQVMINELPPLHHGQGELGVRCSLGSVDVTRHFPGVGKRGAMDCLGPGERDSIFIFRWQ